MRTFGLPGGTNEAEEPKSSLSAKRLPPKELRPKPSAKGKGSPYEQRWDLYVDDWGKTIKRVQTQEKDKDRRGDHSFRNTMERGGKLEYPGDEWGGGLVENWNQTFGLLFPVDEISKWRHVIEIGSGGGKFTALLLERNPGVRIACLDVSSKFLGVIEKRFADIYGKQVFTYHIDCTRPYPVEEALAELNWDEGIDALFSIDAMVHVDLQHLMSYLVSAARQLKKGGYLIMTLADCTTEAGFNKLIKEVEPCFLAQGQPTARFEWTSPDAVRFVVERLGFEIVTLESPGRDLHLVARLREFPAEVNELMGERNRNKP